MTPPAVVNDGVPAGPGRTAVNRHAHIATAPLEPLDNVRRIRWLGLAMVVFGLCAVMLREFAGLDPQLVELASIPCVGLGLLLFAAALAGGRRARRRQTGNR